MSSATLDERELSEVLDAGLAELSLELPDGARGKLIAYVALLDKWNRTYNLTAIRDPARMLSHHLLDCLAVLPLLDSHCTTNTRILDVGSGAGLPGIPLALARPGWRVDMLEPVHKKASFIAQSIAELGIANAHSIAARVEDHGSDEAYAIVVSRAFADLAAFAQAAARHVARDGVLVAMKGVHPHEELSELAAEYTVHAITPLQVPGVEGARHLVVIRHA
ncbi:MAG TPA: 16S rRNA (guanine(527)-N(7))-methyltransferase RsmG [Casimicrobiaceae bacterium]|nr:16S rRNA (guanine(527)-N(7))-methyltransferase RsmG [Casimicrobiaceae bacterium]